MPWDENTFSSESIFSSDDSFGEDVTVVGNFGVHIVDKEWFSEMIFIVREWHCLEVKSHSGSTFDITDFIHTSSGVGISVEELSSSGQVFWEVWVSSTFVPFLIVIDNMESLWVEKFRESFVSKNLIEYINFINCWFSTFISYS